MAKIMMKFSSMAAETLMIFLHQFKPVKIPCRGSNQERIHRFGINELFQSFT